MKEATLKAKEAEVAEIQEKLQKSQSVMFLDYRGLTVSEVTELRNKMRAAGVEYKVIKNTMMRRAAQEAGVEGLDEILEGPTAVAFGYEDPVAPAKILVDFIENAKKTERRRAGGKGDEPGGDQRSRIPAFQGAAPCKAHGQPECPGYGPCYGAFRHSEKARLCA